MIIVTLRDRHPGAWVEGLKVVLCEAESPYHGKFTTCVLAPGEEPRGMFSKIEGPLQVVAGTDFTMVNLGRISEEERQLILKGGTVVQHYEYEVDDFVFEHNEIKLKERDDK